MAKKHPHKRAFRHRKRDSEDFDEQDPGNRFFSLPREIRNLIYQFALTKPDPIDLWLIALYKEGTQSEDLGLHKRLEKCMKANEKLKNMDTIYVRKQTDLAYVRKEMATGLLATCMQVYNEAWPFFWRHNTFRFSGDVHWLGVRRFLTSIGARARSQLGTVEVIIPCELNENGWRHRPSMQCPGWEELGLEGKRYWGTACDMNTKNWPKMGMVKVLGEDRWIEREGNVSYVLHMMKEENMVQSLKSFRFILPPHVAIAQCGWEGTQWEQRLECEDFHVPEALVRAEWLPKTLVVEKNARLEGQTIREMLKEEGFDILFKRDSVWKPSTHPESVDMRPYAVDTLLQVKETEEHDTFRGFQNLFIETADEVPAKGGRATRYCGSTKHERVLKGFGGCRFMIFQGWHCLHCEWRHISLGEAGKCEQNVLPSGELGQHRVEFANCVTLKKYQRVLRNGEIQKSAWHTDQLW